MILRSPLAALLFILSLAFVLLAVHSDTEGPTVQECQEHIEAAIKAFHSEHDSKIDDDDDFQVHSTETNDLNDIEEDIEKDELPQENVDDTDDDEDTEESKGRVDEDEDDRDVNEENEDNSEAANVADGNELEDDEVTVSSDKTVANDDDDDDDDDDDQQERHEKDVQSRTEEIDDEDEAELEEKQEAEEDDEKEESQKDVSDNEETLDIEEVDESDDETEEKVEKDETEDEDEEETKKSELADDGDEDEENESADAIDDHKEHKGEDEETDDESEMEDKDKESEETKKSDDEDEGDQEIVEKRSVIENDEASEDNVVEKIEDDEEEEAEKGIEKAEEGKAEEEIGGAEEDKTDIEVEEQIETTEEDLEEVLVAGPGQLRSREHIEQILRVGEEELSANSEIEKAGNDILKEVKKLYEGAVKPLENLYKFKDISSRHLGDAEIFSKPMVVFMGPWSSGKSAIVNYLLGTEYTKSALKTGAEPTSNSFNVIMYGDQSQIIDGTQLAADWAFSSLQKFGQGFLDRLKGRKINSPILKKMTIVDTPGIIENRKVNERMYPFNDAFQWFIDRADLIYVVFDPTKLDIGLEMEALFDQLKGRESQVRILLNKADTVKPQELMKVQGNILWNLSPVLSTANAPTIYVGSFWSKPYIPGSPDTLFDAQEQAFLEDVHEALETQVENKVALARRHAVRVRNHAKMVDCYLNTYYNHKTFFSNKRKVADDIVENPQNYHIYEGMSTLTNVSRYDLPDPDIYKEFFSVHPLFDFKPLASTCSYFKGCPLDKLDITIAYDLPELVSKYHRILSNRPSFGGR